MSRARHHGKHHGKHATGGATGSKPGSGSREHEIVAGNPDVFKEAEDKHGTMKHGGRAKKHHGKHHGKHHRAEGGKVVGLMTGGAVRPRLDRPGRKRGGRVGADTSPLSSAHKGEHSGGSTPHSGDSYGGRPPD